MSQKFPDVFSTHSAARFCRVTPMTIIRWINESRIRAYKTPGGHRRIMRADLEDFCRQAQIPLSWEVPEEGHQTRKALIIADDRAVVETLLDALMDQEAGEPSGAFEVEQAHSAFEAGRLLAQGQPDFVFLDLALPGLPPNQVVDFVRANLTSARLVALGDGVARLPGFDEVLARNVAAPVLRQITGPLPKLPR